MTEFSNEVGGMEVEAPAAEPLVAGGGGPPAHWTKIADWSNTIAGIVLMMAFFEGALISNVNFGPLVVPTHMANGTATGVVPGVPNAFALFMLQFLFCFEGALYAIGGFYMCGIMACIPPPIGGGNAVMQFVILTAGGIFFGFSGLAFPPCITNITYIFSPSPCLHAAAGGSPYVYNAMAHYGITCFMVGTSIGFKGVLGIPPAARGAFGTGPFWGSTMFFLGAWTIGIFKFWGPVLMGGFSAINESEAAMAAGGFDYSAPAVTMTFTWWIAFIGAGFLTYGAIIFGKMDGTF